MSIKQDFFFFNPYYFGCWVKISADNSLKWVSYFFFSKKIGFEISCKLFPRKVICMSFKFRFLTKKKNKKHDQFCRLLNCKESAHGHCDIKTVFWWMRLRLCKMKLVLARKVLCKIVVDYILDFFFQTK